MLQVGEVSSGLLLIIIIFGLKFLNPNFTSNKTSRPLRVKYASLVFYPLCFKVTDKSINFYSPTWQVPGEDNQIQHVMVFLSLLVSHKLRRTLKRVIILLKKAAWGLCMHLHKYEDRWGGWWCFRRRSFILVGKRAWNQVSQNDVNSLVRQEGKQREEQTKQAVHVQCHQLSSSHLYSNTKWVWRLQCEFTNTCAHVINSPT